jgi:hypothetical protein
MRLLRRPASETAEETAGVVGSACLQCGTPAGGMAFCRRCGLPVGAPPRADVELPSCHICYRTVDDDGQLPSLAHPGRRVDLMRHLSEHDRHPVGDDDYLESLRSGDRIRIGRWSAPFDVVRRYLVTGNVEGGRRRAYEHNAIVNAMTQLKRWGPDAGAKILGDQPEWEAAREAVSQLMERYHRGAVPRRSI